jgi:hypothetical protein
VYSDLDPRQQQRITRVLRNLPADARPPYGWNEFQQRVQERKVARRQGLQWGLGAVAASLLIIVSGIVLLSRGGAVDGARTQARVSVGVPTRPELPVVMDPRTRDAERWLASLPPEPVVVRFGTRMAVTQLEDRIAQVDDLMSIASANEVAPGRLDALRQERSRLVKSLAQVRYAETLAADLR